MPKYKIYFEELVRYSVEIETDRLRDVAERWREIDEEGEFHPLNDFLETKERELREICEVLPSGLDGTDYTEDVLEIDLDEEEDDEGEDPC